MKRQAYMLALAFILMLTMCGAHLKGGQAAAPATTSTAEVVDQRPFFASRTDANISFGHILSWFAGGLLRTATANADDAIADQGPDAEADPVPDRSANGNSGADDKDPYRLKARFRTPAHPLTAANSEQRTHEGR
jgi:hypothetical protein